MINTLGKVEKHFSGLDVQDKRISVDQFISELKGKGVNQMTLIQVYEFHLKCLEKLSGIDFAVTIFKKYGYTLNSLKQFLKSHFGMTDIRLRDLVKEPIKNRNN